ncbi:AAA family ATPase [Paraburkholderia sp. 22099]|jgi:pilus assembly protein CpaE|uniref:Pilus assembly protein CpaE n=1 Tax=Paraburkholderia terricola TaxID=169427 RepID=A0ABU1LKK0_9BURK|nr:AAA family ATPase [Paraburkholderia terricola]ORC51778.1 pilus assembly protein [Burkholderia sp. A27]AXE95740.1 pilus assembly protein [Paraburkholderia terricola]MDR6407259.1 pilus assembly protein CpaE [Paraburkholderia terricola]MDR6445203.1 pilus assembly protein CpaE [Paraburkholderia terricola]MDR6479063.1 pilus assembly protein CpaE [Paraburkholderia terricola]
MINILITSEDATRLAQIVRLIGECGNYRTTRVAGRPSLLIERGDSLDAFDVLIVDAASLDAAELPVVARLCSGRTHVTSILLIPDASPQTLIEAMRAGFRDVLGWPLNRASLGDALSRIESQRALNGAHETQIVSFLSCKGGAGTSFIASNVAHAISETQKKRVLLIDLNQLFGDAAFLVTEEKAPSTLPQMCAQVERMDAAFFDACLVHVSDTFHILAGAGDPIKASEIKEERLEWILGVAVPRYDMVIFDLGQSVNALSILALDRSDQIHLVLQASMPHVRAGRRLQEILASLAYPADRTRLLLNRYTRHGERARAALEEVLGMRPYQVIPEDTDTVLESVNHGVPITKVSRTSSVSRSLLALAGNIVSLSAGPEGSRVKSEPLLSRFFGRQPAPKLKAM